MAVAVKSSKAALRAISLLWVSSIGTAGMAFLTEILLSRCLGRSDYGRLSSAYTTVMLIAPLAGFGIGSYWLRLFGLEGWNARRWLAPSFKFITISSVATCLILVVLSFCGHQSSNTRVLLFWLSPLVFCQALNELLQGRFQLEERYKLLSLWQAVPYAARFAIAISTFILGERLLFVTVGYSATAILLVILSIFLVSQMLRGKFHLAGHGPMPEPAAKLNTPSVWQVPAGSWPFAFASVFYLLYAQSAIPLLEKMAGPAAAGTYKVAFTVMSGVYILPTVIYQKYLMPKLQRWAEHDRARFLAVYRFGNGGMIFIGGIVMLLLLLLSHKIVWLVFGEQYKVAGALITILALSTPLKFLSTSVGGTLVTQNHMCRKVWYQCAVAIFNVTLNIILIPRYSYYGAVITTLCSEALLLCIYLKAVNKHVFGADAWKGWNLDVKSIALDEREGKV